MSGIKLAPFLFWSWCLTVTIIANIEGFIPFSTVTLVELMFSFMYDRVTIFSDCTFNLKTISAVNTTLVLTVWFCFFFFYCIWTCHIFPERCVLIFESRWYFYILYNTVSVVNTHLYCCDLACGCFIIKVITLLYHSFPLPFPLLLSFMSLSFCHSFLLALFFSSCFISSSLFSFSRLLLVFLFSTGFLPASFS